MNFTSTLLESLNAAVERGPIDPADMLAGIKNRAVVIGSDDFVEWARELCMKKTQPWYAPLQFQIEHSPIRLGPNNTLVWYGMDGWESAELELVEVIVFPDHFTHAFVRRAWKN